MNNPDDSDFDDFVQGVLNTSFSSALGDQIQSSDDDHVLLHNLSPSDTSDGEDIPMQLPYTQQQAGRPNIDSWTDVTNYDPGPNTIPIYNVNQGPVLPDHFNSETLPIEYFNLFFNEDVLTKICDETNLFAEKRKSNTNSPHARINKWNNISLADLRAFLGVVINMGTMPLPNIESYFSKKWTDLTPFYSDVFSKNEFLNIFWNIHFSHDTENARLRPKGFQIQPLVNHIKSMCQLFYTTSSAVAIDESTISFKGKVSFRCYNPMKPTKFGLKVFVLSDCINGYIYNFIPYYGKEQLIANSNLLKTTQIVKILAESVVYKDPQQPTTGLHIFTDRYYTGPEIAKELLAMKTNLTGTVMPTRLGMPPNLKRDCKTLRKGQIMSKRKGDILVVSWKDKRLVTVLSTFSKGSNTCRTEILSKWPNQPPILKPDVVINYTKHMGAVDRSDHFISSYQFMRRTRKWYRKMFFWLFEVSIVNSYILYKTVQIQHHKKPMSHLDFRKSLVSALVEDRVASRPSRCKRGRPSQGPPDQRLLGKHYVARKPNGGRSRCVVCLKNGMRKETIYVCKTCVAKPGLHPDECFEVYHSQPNF